ncbi:MAG: hypothetical protein H0W25_02860 [Acidimicrobiia bacterium]|nr:hypothetical protein [Acidimicrobiia bacterium]
MPTASPTPPRLDDLIALARAQAESDEPIALLSAAATLKAEVDELTDALLGHFVDQARRAGCSWSQIGAALGVTKQAAQQKHAPTFDFSRFTERARTAMTEAQAASRRFGHPYLGTEHLLAGLAAGPEAVAGSILIGAGLDQAAVDAAIDAIVGRCDSLGGSAHVPYTPKAALALAATLQEALSMGHDYIGTEHLLLALTRSEESVGRRILDDAALTHEKVRGQVVRFLTALQKGG